MTKADNNSNEKIKKGRTELIGDFSSGKMPTAKGFEDFINSTFNLRDDNIDISNEFGYELKSQEGTGALISFFTDNDITKPLLRIWHKEKGNKENVFLSTSKKDGDFLKINENGQITFLNEHPVKITGAVEMESRIGLYERGSVKADGNYHEILKIEDDKVQIFEVVACLNGPKNTGKHAAMHAIAIALHKNSWFNRIRQTNAFFAWPWNRLKLKWRVDRTGNDGNSCLKLYLKTRSNYWKKNKEDDSFEIQYHVTKLWNNRLNF